MRIENWPIVKQAADIFGFLMRCIYLILSNFGIYNIAVCVIVFAVLFKLVNINKTYKQQKLAMLSPKIVPQVETILKKYEGRLEHPLTNTKLNIDKGYTLNKYGIATPRTGCLSALINLPIAIAIYAIIQNMTLYIPELNQLSAEKLEQSHTFLSLNIAQAPGFKFSIAYIFPILTASLNLAESLQSSMINKTVNNGKLVGGISNAMIVGMMFYFSATIPIICSIFWITNSIINLTTKFLMKKYIEKKDLEYFEKKYTKKLNKNRIKRGLAPLTI